ncbi:monooxygenase FAD-binding protein [Halalkaliarchaeum desulfuricum]|uniref:Monooxygenase FAD-binding protein n=1 Tax=Halalkaliarchaeum desulfuricum TaxID=2055893 RepID=A0A343TK69_9EURY|nr:FAD-dependent monooxygenase [Halalkaliarchaeum desulfuricum]AUX09491.1 monooxygenase FAD-binding protein [Halalkaliarchaeum desulfuricum]
MTLSHTRRYDPARVSERDGHAVVIGASVAGLLAGRVLSDGFASVTIIDKDSLPDEPVARKGVPQSDHAHLLMEAGRATIEDLFPGYCEDLIAAGALLLDGASDVNHYLEGDFMADGTERVPMYAASRPLFEQQIRRRVRDLSGVRLRAECSFVDYLSDDAGDIKGVTVSEGGTEDDIHADLVVDATGRTSRTPNWLTAHGYDAPDVEEVTVDTAYSTGWFERPPDRRWSIAMLPDAPRKRGWVAIPIENDEWIVGLSGIHGVRPPTEPEAFEEYIANCPTSVGRWFVETYEFADREIEPYPFPSNVRRYYERLDDFPDGLVVVGDAITSFNPIYGQGMSVAALESLVLHSCLADGYRSAIATEFFERASPILDVAWQMAIGTDFAFEETTGSKPTGLSVFNRYMSRLVRKAHSDGRLRTAFYRVMMMEQPPTSLFRPSIARRVLSPRTRTTGASVDPAALMASGKTTPAPGDD